MAFPLDHEMVPVFGTRKNKKENGNNTDKQSVLFPLVSVLIRVPSSVNGTRKNKKENGNDTDKAIRPFSVGFRVHPCPFIG